MLKRKQEEQKLYSKRGGAKSILWRSERRTGKKDRGKKRIQGFKSGQKNGRMVLPSTGMGSVVGKWALGQW